MVAIIYIAFFVGTVFYLGAALFSVRFLWSSERRLLSLATQMLVVGALAWMAVFGLRWAQWYSVPLTTMTDALCLFTLMCSGIILYVVYSQKVPALLSFYLPPLAIICLLNATTAHRFLSQEPRALSGLPLAVHVGLAFLAYAFFFVASMTSAAYLCQASHLKHHRMTLLSKHLPSLAELDGTLSRLMGIGYPLFVFTLIQGLFWAFVDRALLGPHWWFAPKVTLALAMALFYAATFHLRRAGRLRGVRLAYLVFIGFMLLLGLYVGLSLLNLRGYSFWGAKP